MTTKEKIETIIKIHTRVVTGIFLFICLYLLWLPGDTRIRIIDILGVQLIGLISGVAYLPLITDKELSKTKMFVYNALYCLTINITVILFGYFFHWFSFKSIGTVIAIELMFIAVYSLMMIIAYRIDTKQAKKFNEKLLERNKDKED